MRILLISTYFPPALTAEAICVGKFAKALRKRGVEVDVITTQNTDKCGIDDSSIWKVFDNNPSIHNIVPPQNAIIRKTKSLWWKIMLLYPSGSWWVAPALAMAKQKHKVAPYDLVISRAGNENSLIVGKLLSKKCGVPWIAALNDPRPQSLLPPPYNKKMSNYFDSLNKYVMKKTLCDASSVLFPSERLLQYMKKKLNIKCENNIILPHIGYNAEPVSSDKKKLLILHSGTIYIGRNIEGLLRAFKTAKENLSPFFPDIELLFLGEIDNPGKKIIADLNLSDIVTIRDPVSYEKSLEEMQESSALLLIEAVLEEGIFLPSKFCDYAMSRKPLLIFSPRNGSIADIVGKDHPGLLGQTEEEATKALETFFRVYAFGNGLERYLCPDPEQFSENRIMDNFIDYVTQISARLSYISEPLAEIKNF